MVKFAGTHLRVECINHGAMADICAILRLRYGARLEFEQRPKRAIARKRVAKTKKVDLRARNGKALLSKCDLRGRRNFREFCIHKVPLTKKHGKGSRWCQRHEEEDEKESKQPQDGNSYGSVNVSGTASAILGNVNNYFQTTIQHASLEAFASILLQQMRNPLDAIDLLSSVAVDAYTTRSGVPSLYTYFSRSIVLTDSFRQDEVTMLYVRSSRQCVRITISLFTTIDSTCWQLMESHCDDRTPGILGLPYCIIASLENHLKNNRLIQQDSHLRVLADKSGILTRANTCSRLSTTASPSSVHLEPLVSNVTSNIPLTNHAWYSESALLRRPLFIGKQSNHLLASVPPDRKWMLETRLCPDIAILTNQLYCMDVLCRFGHMAGIPQFAGVIRDQRGSIVSFLTELPSKGILHAVMRHAEQRGHPVGEERRLKWCRQVLQLVAALHSNGFVLGLSSMLPYCPITIDGDDNAVLWPRFQRMVESKPSDIGALPPECCHNASPTAATFETDLYQLGLMLWHIIADKTVSPWSEFCKSADCTTPADMRCRESHTNPTTLPMPEKTYPKYLREIITLCRSENPKQRPSARKLLAILPPCDSKKDLTHNNACSMSYFPRPEQYYEVFKHDLNCDRCPRQCSEPFFHCPLCLEGDFDLCHTCFLSGEHCLDDSHLLREFRREASEDKCYTKVQASGRREVVFV